MEGVRPAARSISGDDGRATVGQYRECLLIIPQASILGRIRKVRRLGQGRHMQYEKPEVTDFGSIAGHTFLAGGSDNFKGGGDVQHLDKFCEWSGGSDPDSDACNGPVEGA